ncbi:beta-galactosidase, partial [Ruminococcus sp.]|uniref:beta-galactosidase n=1 Tax=Ruminococcus sp. TaxID=41978 RepID=UPI002D04B07A
HPKAWQNPALCLEYTRFSADMTAKFAHDMAMIIKRENPRAKVTTNTLFSENTPDFYKLFSNLDFVSYDNYPPVRLTDDEGMSSSHAFYLDMMRGVKQKNFWVMEQLSGPTGSWMPMGPTPPSGSDKGICPPGNGSRSRYRHALPLAYSQQGRRDVLAWSYRPQ